MNQTRLFVVPRSIQDVNLIIIISSQNSNPVYLQDFEFVLPPTTVSMFDFFTHQNKPRPTIGPEGTPPPKRITVGCRVKGKIGELVPNPDCPKEQKVRSHGTGTVVEALGRHKWRVKTDYDGTYLTGTSRTLVVIDESFGIPANEAVGVHKKVSLLLTVFYFISTLNKN